MMRYKVVKVTPRIAEAWLLKNVTNRELRAGVVDTYANAIRRGDWRLSPQGIAFDEAGNLQDGQHRLNAVIASGIAVDMIVWENVASDVFEVTDVGAKRSVGDILSISTSTAAIGTFIAKLHDPDIRGAVTAQMTQPYLKAFSAYITNLLDGNGTSAKTWAATPVRVAAILKIASGEDRDYVRSVYWALIHRDYDLMPLVARALFNQHLDGDIRGAMDMFARCLTVFTKEKANLKRVQITSKDTALKFARGVITDVMAGKEKAPTKAAPKVKVIRNFTTV